MALPSPTALTLPSLLTVTTEALDDINLTYPASAGIKVALITVSSSTFNFKDLFLTSIEVLILLTVTVIVVELIAWVLLSPTSKVIIVSPSFKATTVPFSSTDIIPELSTLYVIGKPSGVVVALIVVLSPTSKVISSATTLASLMLTVTAIVLFSAAYLSLPANETVIVAVPSPFAMILRPITSTTS